MPGVPALPSRCERSLLHRHLSQGVQEPVLGYRSELYLRLLPS